MNGQTATSIYDKKRAERIEREESLTQLSSYVMDIFEAFKAARRPWEEIWEECWLNYLGQYQQSLVWRKESEGNSNRSKVFIKLTTLKCNSAHAKIVDAIFAGDRGVPFECTPVLVEMMGIPVEQAKELAHEIKRKLKDHFRAIELDEILDSAILEMAILGTGVLKGPIIDTRRRMVARERLWQGMPVRELDSGVSPYELVQIEESIPIVSHVPLWEYYVDPNAKNTRDSIGEMHFTRLLPADFRRLAYQGGYDGEAVHLAAQRATATDENDERYRQLGDNWMGEQGVKDERVSHLEYWGLVPVSMLREHGCELPEDIEDEDSIEGLVALGADGLVIKACVNPVGRRPFYVAPYKKRPHIIFGQGVAEAMRDSQKMVNSSARLIVDNKALSGNGMVAVNIDRINTKRTRDFKVYPGKTWFVKGNFSPNEAVGSVTFPDITNGLKELMEMFERFADEETGIPKYTHGEQGSFLNKMLDVNTPVPMADGTYKSLEHIVDGDKIIGRNGKPTLVIKAHPAQLPKRAYEIKFRSGDVVVAGGEHLWTFQTSKIKEWTTINTDNLYERYEKYKATIYVPRVQRPEFDGNEELPLDPYILGLWLGNGHTTGARITMPDDKGIMEYINQWLKDAGGKLTLDSYQNSGKAKTYTISGIGTCRSKRGQFLSNGSLHSILKGLGLLKKYKKNAWKYIPEAYLRSSYESRLALLRGIMDTDGCHHSGSLAIFTQKEGQLLDDVIKLIISLGGFPKVHEVFPNNDWVKEGVKYYQAAFSLIDNPFGDSKKGRKWRPSRSIHARQRIVSMKEVDIRPMRCLTVDAQVGLYCVGNRFTLTHNTATGMSMLMGQANLNLKTVIKNIDDFWIEPIVEAFYAWLTEMAGMAQMPLKLKATGSDSLIAKELKLENYMKFMQVSAAPQDAIFMDRVKLMKSIARLLETEDVMRADEEIKGIMEEMTRQAMGVKNLRETIAIDRLYPLLTRQEQMQVLKELGIEPDAQTKTAENPKEQIEFVAMGKKLEMEGARLQNEIVFQDKKLELERAKLETDIGLKREEIERKAEIEREKVLLDAQIRERENERRFAIEEKRVEAENRRAERDETVPPPAPVPAVLPPQPGPIHVHIDSKKGLVSRTTNGKVRKRAKIIRDEKGEITGADIEEENE